MSAPERPDDQMAREIAEGPEAVAATLAELDGRRAEVARMLAAAGRIVVVATGASLAMSRAAAPAWRRALPTGVDLVVRQSTEAAIGGPDGAIDGFDLRASDVVVAVSQSGTSPETLAAARQGRGAGARVLAITAYEESQLAALASLVVRLRSGQERDASTKSALATLAALLSLAEALPAGPEAVEGLVDRLRTAAGDESAVAPDARLLAAARHAWFLGFGSALGIAEAGALLWHEKVIRAATAATPSEFRHGLIEAAGPDDAVVLIDVDAPDDARAAYLARLRDELAALRVAVVELGIGVPEAAGAALEALLRLQQLAHATAVAAGTYRDGFAVLRATVLPASDIFEAPVTQTR